MQFLYRKHHRGKALLHSLALALVFWGLSFASAHAQEQAKPSYHLQVMSNLRYWVPPFLPTEFYYGASGPPTIENFNAAHLQATAYKAMPNNQFIGLMAESQGLLRYNATLRNANLSASGTSLAIGPSYLKEQKRIGLRTSVFLLSSWYTTQGNATLGGAPFEEVEYSFSQRKTLTALGGDVEINLRLISSLYLTTGFRLQYIYSVRGATNYGTEANWTDLYVPGMGMEYSPSQDEWVFRPNLGLAYRFNLNPQAKS